MTAVTHMCYKHNNKQTKGKCSQLKDWRSVWICTFLRFLCWCQVHLSSYHSIIPFNLANKKWKNSQYLVFLFFKHWKLVFVFLFNGKYNKTRKPVNKEIINLIFILRYCYTMSHGTFLLWGIKVRFVFYVINNTLRNQKQVLFFVFLILGKKKTEITNLAWFLVFLFVLTKQIYHSIFPFHWWVGLRHPIASDWLVCSINYMCAVLFKIKVLVHVSVFRQCNVSTNCDRQTRGDYVLITDHTDGL